MTLRPLLDRYVRSLLEREPAADAPEIVQDLGTLIDWLLRRQGFIVHRRVYRYEGPERRKLSGEREAGIDIIASRNDGHADRVYLFVLKRGNVGIGEWSDDRGSIKHDLGLLEDYERRDLERFGIPSNLPLTLIAAHNGDLQHDQVGLQANRKLKYVGERLGAKTEWWTADRIVDELLEPTEDGETLDTHADATLFPPRTQPFARMATDSLHLAPYANAFDDRAAEFYVNERLPLDRPTPEKRRGSLPRGDAQRPDRIHRALTEMTVFAGMLAVECRARTAGNYLPALDLMRRIAVRAVEHIRRLKKPSEVLTEDLSALLGLYLDTALVFLDGLSPLLREDRGLAVPQDSEQLDYPLRIHRLVGHLSSAGLAALDLRRMKDARLFGEAVYEIRMNQRAGFLMPVMDDQVIEHYAAWMLWEKLEQPDWIQDAASALVGRLADRRAFGRPLPATWILGFSRLTGEQIDILVARYVGRRSLGWEDHGSLLLPWALLHAHGTREIASKALEPFVVPHDRGRLATPVVLQTWVPAQDHWEEAYATTILYSGIAHVYHSGETFAAFINKACAACPDLDQSPAERLGFGCIDSMAAQLFRNVPWFSDQSVPSRSGSIEDDASSRTETDADP